MEPMAAMAGMATAGLQETADKPELSYVNRLDHDGDPSTMPEIAREMTMLRGAVGSVDQAIHNTFDEFELLLRRLQPIVDQTPRPATDPSLKDLTKAAPPVTTGIGGDLRSVYEHLGVLEAQLDTLQMRLRNLSAMVRL